DRRRFPEEAAGEEPDTKKGRHDEEEAWQSGRKFGFSEGPEGHGDDPARERRRVVEDVSVQRGQQVPSRVPAGDHGIDGFVVAKIGAKGRQRQGPKAEQENRGGHKEPRVRTRRLPNSLSGPRGVSLAFGRVVGSVAALPAAPSPTPH